MSHIKGVNNVLADALSRRKYKDLVNVQWEIFSNEMLHLSLYIWVHRH